MIGELDGDDRPRMVAVEMHRSARRRVIVYRVTPEGTPFLCLGGTAWESCRRLSREETEVYLVPHCASRGFAAPGL